jgi:transcriptional regulator with XRE-family HTH domain
VGNQFGEALRALRQSLGMRQVDVEATAGLAATSLSHLEAGRRSASRDVVLTLARVLGADAEWLVRLSEVERGVRAHPQDERAKRLGGEAWRWTAAEIGLLTELAADGKPYQDIAKVLGRSGNAVLARARKAGVRLASALQAD